MPPSAAPRPPTLLDHPELQKAAAYPEHEPMWERETFRLANGGTVELVAVGRSINEAAAQALRLARRLVRNAPPPMETTAATAARIDLGR